ncbi:TPA: hypothetical protein DEP96_01480 [Candidatus Uhrbacteria bacterium]|nr:hypothetical protein [Candidatus Uhrbacteria bacterium]
MESNEYPSKVSVVTVAIIFFPERLPETARDALEGLETNPRLRSFFIAKPDGEIDWQPTAEEVAKLGEDFLDKLCDSIHTSENSQSDASWFLGLDQAEGAAFWNLDKAGRVEANPHDFNEFQLDMKVVVRDGEGRSPDHDDFDRLYWQAHLLPAENEPPHIVIRGRVMNEAPKFLKLT